MRIGRFQPRGVICAIVGFAALIASGTAAADPPARVARLANIGGPVSFSPAGEDEWVFATPNRPLVTGDRVWTDAGARAELQIGSLAVRVGSRTSVTILNLDDRVAQFQLEQGVLNVRVRRIDPGETIEIDTPLLAFSLRAPGDYRIDVDPASAATSVAVRSGRGEVYGEGAAYAIAARQWYRFADSALRNYEYDALPAADAFDTWARDRDRREDRPVAARYVSPDVIGYADLDDYGSWSAVEGYGNVWVPTSVPRDWAPYRDGRWAWIEPWGWTWVDDAPWGFAPFHYGRWAYARERWCWVPGPLRARPVYAPALVAFVGGSNFRISSGGGGPARGVAWFPLAPGEVYRPAYRASRNYFTNVNVSNTNVSAANVVNIYNRPDAPGAVYRNRDQRGAMTAVPADVFVQSRPVARAAVAVTREVAAAAPVTAMAAIAPVRASVIGGGPGDTTGGALGAGQRSAAPGAPPATARRPVIARVAPPPSPTPFQAREASLAKDPGRPPDPATFAAARPGVAVPAAPAVKVVAPAGPGTPPPAPTVSRSRGDTLPTAPGGAPPGSAGAPAAPSAGAAPTPPPRPGMAVPVPQPPPSPSQVQGPPGGRDRGGPAPKTEVPAPPAVPAGVRTSPPPSQPPAPPVPQPPKATEVRPALQPPTGQQTPAAPAEVRREPPPPAVVNRPPVPAPLPEQRREAAPAPPVAQPPPAPVPPRVEVRREPPPPPAPVPVPPATRPAAPPAPPAELRREPPAPSAPVPPAARPAAPPPPPAELRREPPPPPAPVPPAATPPAPPPPPAELRREPPPPPARPPVVQAPPAAAPAPPAANAAPAAVVRQPEARPKAEPVRGDAPKPKSDEKRDEPK